MKRKLAVLALSVAICVPFISEADSIFIYSSPFIYQEPALYGSWLFAEHYGLVWQSSIVLLEENWRPYCCGGRWYWTYNGWYWQPYYVSGWMPFNYGWWVYSSYYGWVWMPSPYWSPAWVCWRTAPGYCYYGWIPLPPPPTPGAYLNLGFDSAGVFFGASFSLGCSRSVFEQDACLFATAADSKIAAPAETEAQYLKSEPSRDFTALREKAENLLINRPSIATSKPVQSFIGNKPTAAEIVQRNEKTPINNIVQQSKLNEIREEANPARKANLPARMNTALMANQSSGSPRGFASNLSKPLHQSADYQKPFIQPNKTVGPKKQAVSEKIVPRIQNSIRENTLANR